MLENDMNTSILKSEYRKLLRRKSLIEPEFNEIRDQLDTINRQIAGLDQVLLAAGEDTAEIRKSTFPHVEIREEEEPRKLQEEIFKVLGDIGQPLHYKKITDLLLQSAISVPGKDPYNTVSAYLNRFKSMFTKAPEKGRGYYQLKE